MMFWRKNEVLSSKLEIILKENNSLKNKIILISKELDLISNENKSLKNDLSSHVCHISCAPSTSDKHVACSTSSSILENDICALKKSVDCLSFTLSQCVMDHTWLESMFLRNMFLLCMYTIDGIHMLIMLTHMILCMLMCTLVHIVDVRAPL